MRGDHTLGMSHRKPETGARFDDRSQTIVKAASHADLLSSRNPVIAKETNRSTATLGI